MRKIKQVYAVELLGTFETKEAAQAAIAQADFENDLAEALSGRKLNIDHQKLAQFLMAPSAAEWLRGAQAVSKCWDTASEAIVMSDVE